MLDDTLNKIELRIKNSSNIQDDNKEELLNLVRELRTEVTALSKTDAEPSESIARFAESSTSEALREKKDPQLEKHALDGLKISVEKFENSHPKLAQAVHKLSELLAKSGI